MKRFICIVIILLGGFVSRAQDVIITLTPLSYGSPTPLDTILIRNYSRAGSAVFSNLPQLLSTFEINLSQSKLINGIDDRAFDLGIFLIKNSLSGSQVLVNLPGAETLHLNLYNIQGKSLIQRDIRCNAGANLIGVSAGNETFCLLSIRGETLSKCFKIAGGAGYGPCDISLREPASQEMIPKSLPAPLSGDLNFTPGDLLAITVIKAGLYSNTKLVIPEDGDFISISMAKPCPGVPTVTDIDGNVYNTVLIGTKCWMRENMNATRYADGTPLVDGTGIGDITMDFHTKYWFNYNDDPFYSLTYGKLYTGSAVMNGVFPYGGDSLTYQGICPDGWHVSSDREWMRMEALLGMGADTLHFGWRGYFEGAELKEADTIHWLLNYNYASTNELGFTALPAGVRISDGTFRDINETTAWWVAYTTGSSSLIFRALSGFNYSVARELDGTHTGSSCRCVKD